MNALVRRRDKTLEQRVRLVRLALELRMKLARDEKRMPGQLDDFHQLAIRGKAAEHKTGLLEFFTVGVVEFIPMAVPFVDDE